MVRGGVSLVLLVAVLSSGLGAGSGCGGSKPSPLNCTRSVTEFCSTYSQYLVCPLTWDDVQAGQVMCVSGFSYEISDCGNYRRLTYRGDDGGFSFYYDAASGQLVAIVGGGVGGEGCAGPPGVFEIPPCDLPDAGPERIDCAADGSAI